MFNKRTIKGIPKSQENLEENMEGYHVFGQNIYYQYPQKVLNEDKYLTKIEEGKPIIAYTSSTAQIGIINESFYRTGDNGAFQGLFPIFKEYNYNHMLFILVAVKRKFIGFDYNTSMAHIIDLKIKLPTKKGEIDFDFMEAYISELEEERISELAAYLTVSGLDNYELSNEEKQAIEDYDTILFDDYKFKDIFNNIKQGRRLKKDDQIPGNIPFVMSGITNTGIIGYISNPVTSFYKNSITIDIFGNSFYRNYDFGAGDDTGVYWNDEVTYTKETMLYFTTAMEKTLFGKYSYGKKLRSSQSFNFKIKLPKKKNEIDFSYMQLLISAIQKLVIKDVVDWADKKIQATREVANQ